MPCALVLCGGWEGHEPGAFVDRYRELLELARYDVVVAESLDVLESASSLQTFDLIVPAWTMGELTEQQEAALVSAVQGGVGLAGQHGGMGDAFRASTDYQWMVGGQFVWHAAESKPFNVSIAGDPHPITEGIDDFTLTTEQYYLHFDPSIEVLATTVIEGTSATEVEVTMPVVWTRAFGKGRIFYCALGHSVCELDIPELALLMHRGFIWATRPAQ